MGIFINNSNSVLFVCLSLLRWVGFLVSEEFGGIKKILAHFYFLFWFMFIVGFYIISQTISLYQSWGDVNAMTNVSFLLFTNLAFARKILVFKLKKKAVQAMIQEGEEEMTAEERDDGKNIISRMNTETICLLCMYIVDGSITLLGWIVAAATKNQLPFIAWYPYNTSEFPGYHLTFLYQAIALLMVALMNVSSDFVISTLTAICRCRLQLVNLSLRNLCEGITVTNQLLTAEQEELVSSRLQQCVVKHQKVLAAAARIQECFSSTIMVQFMVSTVIICATAYQLAEEGNGNIFWLIPMTSYIVGMIMQVYIYCHEAHKLTEESSLVSEAVYCSPWYSYPSWLRRVLLVVMVRARQPVVLTAGGFATLSLTCFVSIIRISYSFFTVLKQVDQ